MYQAGELWIGTGQTRSVSDVRFDNLVVTQR